MIINATDRSTYLDVSKIEWEPTRFPGVLIRRLYEDPSGRLTTLTRMEKGARLPTHRHVGIEQSYMGKGNRVSRRWRGMRWSGGGRGGAPAPAAGVPRPTRSRWR